MQNTITKYSFSLSKISRKLFLLFLLLFAFQANAADFFWVGGTGNWNDFATHWATTSGGAIFHTNAPTAADNVFFDASSGAAGYTVTLDVVAVATNFTFSGNAFSFDGTNSLTINGTSTNSSTSAITFGGANTYTFGGAYTTVAVSQTRFTGTGTIAFNNSITIGNGSTFSFTPSATTTVTGAFNSTTTCAAPNTINSTAGSATVNFGTASTWNNTNVTNIAATGTVTLQFGTLTTSSGITDNTLLSRNLFWVGGTGNWNNTANWSLTSGGTGGECIPRAIDDVNFDGASALAGNTVTLNVAAPVRNFIYNVAGATFNGANSLTVNGTTTIAATTAITFGGTNVYTFIGNFTAGATTTTDFTTSQALSFGNVTIGTGSTFRFAEPPSSATVSGTFSPNGTCGNNVNISSTATQANVAFTLAQTWNNVNVTLINATSNNVTVQSGTNTVNPGVTNNSANRTLFWVGNTGNWSDPAHWSLSSGGTGGQCPPTALDDANFTNLSFSIGGQSVTMDIDGICRDMNWTGVTNTPRFTGAAARTFTITGSLTFVAGMTQTGLAPTYEGLVLFNSASAQTITMAGRGLGKVRFTTAAAGQWTLKDAFVVRNETLLSSGTFITTIFPVSTGTLTVNNLISDPRTLDLGSSAVTITQAGTALLPALDLRGDDNLFVLNSLPASTITLSASGARVNTGTESKTIPNLTFSGAGTKTIETGSAANTITFRNITVSNGTNFNINGISPKIYQNITIGNNITGTITGIATNLGNSITGNITLGTGGTTTFSGGYAITGNLTAGTTKTVTFTGAGNNNFGGTVSIGASGAFTSSGAKNNTFVGTFTLGTSASTTFSNTPAASTNSFSDINMNSGSIFRFSSVADNTVSGDINVLGSCAIPITLTSNNAAQARLDLANPLILYGATVTNINATNQSITVSNGTIANTTNVFADIVSRDLFWVGNSGNWSDAAHWSLSSGGAGGQCPPTIYDNVRFDALSFSLATQIVDMNVNAFCRNMDWTGVTNTPSLQSIGTDTDLTVGGNLTFVPNMTVGTGGTNPTDIRDIYFAATNALTTPVATPATTNNTIDWGIATETTDGKRFRRAFFNQDAAMPLATTATWTLASAFNLTQNATNPNGTLKLIKGNLVTANNPIEIRILDANGANGSLAIGNSQITLRATGLTFDFRNDTNFNFINPGANSFFSLTSNGANVEGYTGSEAKEMPDIIVTQNTNVTINTDNGANRITFRNIDLQLNNVTFNLTGTSPKTYSTPLSFNNGTNATFTGSSTATPNHNIFTGNIAFGTGVQANFIGDNEFQGTFAVGSTVNTSTGITFTGTGHNQFLNNVTVGATSYFSLQNTSASPNTFTNVTLNNGDVFEFSTAATSTISGAFVAIADCLTPIFVQSSSTGNAATVNFAVAQNWENVTVRDINNTGATVTVISGTNAGNNTNITFNVSVRTLYWVHNGNPLAPTGASPTAFSLGNWNDPNNWSLASGGQTGECPPTLTDDVFFDANSFGAGTQIVNIDVDAQTRDMTWTGATGTPVLTGSAAFTLQMGGSVTLIPAMNFTFAGNFIFRNTKTGTNTLTSATQSFKGNTIFHDNILGTGIWQLADNFETTQTFHLVDGTFTTSISNHTLTAQIIDVFTIANGVGDPTRELNLNSSIANATLNNGIAVDFRGNSANFVLSSTATSELHLTGIGNINMEMGSVAKTIPNIFMDNVGTGNTVNINSSNAENNASRITFRNITALQNNLTFNVNGSAPKTYGNILFPNNALVDFRGVDDVVGVLNLFTGTVIFGTNTRIDFYEDNQFQQPVTIGSTTNAGNAVYFRQNNEFLATAPLTFTNAGQARVTISDGNRINIFRAPVRFEGVQNNLDFNGSANVLSRLEFFSTLFIQSNAGAQALVNFDARPLFHDDVTFGLAAGGNATNPVYFQRGVDFSLAPAGKKFITGNDSRFEFLAAATSILRDMEIGENNVLTFNNDLTVDNMKLSKFDVVNFPNSDGLAANNGVTRINQYITARENCSGWINIRSNLTGVQAQIDFETAHTGIRGFLYTFIQDIFNNDLNGSGLQVVEADPSIVSNIGNNTNITFINAQPSRTFYWVRSNNNITLNQNSTGNWNDLGNDNHWSFSSGGGASGCIPTANDNVIFDDNSFSYAGIEVVTIDKFFSYCKNMSWTSSNANRARLVGDNTYTIQVFGNLLLADFSSDVDWNDFLGTFEFKGTEAGVAKTIESRGSRFDGTVIFNGPYDDWTLVDSMRVEQDGGTGADILINYGDLFSNNQNIRLERNWTIILPTGTLPQSRFIAGTGTVTFDGAQTANIAVYDIQTGAACTECTSGASSCSGSPFYNLTNEKTYNVITQLLTTISILNNFHMQSGYFEDDGFQIRGNATGTVFMQNNTLLRLGANNNSTVFPTCYLPANITLKYGTPDGLIANNSIPVNGSTQASIVEYRCPDEQMVAGGTGFNYATLRLISSNTTQGNNVKRFTGEVFINGAFFMGDEQTIYDMGYQVQGNSHNQPNNSLSTGNNVTLILGTNQTLAERTYTATNVPLNVTIPPAVTADVATTFPKFTVGNGTFGDGVFSNTKVSLSTNSTVIYNANANQEVAGGITYGNIILRSTGSTIATPILKTVTRHNLASAGTMTIAGNALVESFNHFIDAGYQITGNGTGTFVSQANSKLILGNATPLTGGTNFPSLFTRANITLDPNTHETIYNADVPQLMSTEPNYGNVTLTAPTSTLLDLIEKRFSRTGTPSNDLNAYIFGDLLINPRNHLLDDGSQIRGTAPKSVTMDSDVPNQGRSWLTIGTNGATDRNTEFPLTFGTVVLNDSTTVIYNTGSGAVQNVRGAGLNDLVGPTSSYYNLIIQSNNEATARKVLQAPMRIRNNFTIRTGSRFEDTNRQVTGSTLAGILTMEAGSEMYVGANDTAVKNVFPTNYTRARINLNTTSTVRYQSRKTTAPVQLVSSEPVYGNLFLHSNYTAAGTNVPKQIAPTPVGVTNTTLTVNRTLTVDYRVRFEDMGVQIIGNASAIVNNLLVRDGSELVLGTATQVTLFPTLYPRANTNLSHLSATKSTVIYNAGISGSTISAIPNYGNVTLTNAAAAGTVTKELLGTTDIYGNLLIQNRNNLDVTASNHQINLRGNWTCQPSATFDSRSGRVVLNGTTLQQITTNTQKFFELEGSSTGGSFRMIDNITIKTGGKTIFNTGLFIPNDIGPLSAIKMIFEENATVGGSTTYAIGGWIAPTGAPQLLADGPSNASHVVGKVEKQGRDAFMFPIGNGTNYAPAGLSARTNTGASYEARYIGPRLPDADGYFVAQREPLIQVVSHLEYWRIDQLGVNDAAFVYLSWDNPRSQAYNPQGLLVLRWEGPAFAPASLWQDKNKGGYTNNSAKGVIASAAPISTFSPFTLGSFGNFNLLPLDLLAFDAKIEGESVKVTWQTTNEKDNSHYEVERSQDNTSFSSLGTVNAKGTGLEGTFDYQFWDTEPFKGLSYYRLKMVDVDGTFSYSPVRSVLFESKGTGIKGEISLYPNPNGGARFYLTLDGKLNTDAQVEIIDMIGRTVHKQDVQKGSADVVITPLRVLKAGTYILRFVTPQETITRKFVVE